MKGPWHRFQGFIFSKISSIIIKTMKDQVTVLVLRVNTPDFSPDSPQSPSTNSFVFSVYPGRLPSKLWFALYLVYRGRVSCGEVTLFLPFAVSIRILLIETFSASFCFFFKNHRLEGRLGGSVG